MSIIFDIIKDEYKRLLEAQQVYSQRISKEVMGSPRVKQFGKKEYLYVERRQGPRVIYKYIGDLHGPNAAAAMESIKRRKKNEMSLKKVNSDLKDVKRVLRGKI